MSKYVLKKDLPFFNKGREVDAVVKNHLRQEVYIRLGAKIEYLPYDKLFDWIEEIKPETFYIVKAIRHQDIPPEYSLYLSEEEAKIGLHRDKGVIGKIIKAIEEIE